MHPDYWNRPVPASGPARARLLIVGLAPGLHGANRTGKPFTGDDSGELLFSVLRELDIQRSVRITNAVKCLPPGNLPTSSEVDNCLEFLAAELVRYRTVLVLGGVAHRAVVKALKSRQSDFTFAHGAVHNIGSHCIVDSFHCSRYNTRTGRLTQQMFRTVVESAATRAGLCTDG
ncbi:MAG: hypothetical protein KDI19_10505 [Pseudomonadales bacterium]|nr:hypothetical protein [Pseudomonadales bacterium]